MPTRDQFENQRRPYQAYPSTRFHPDGTEIVVSNLAEDEALGPPWAKSPFPPAPAVTQAKADSQHADITTLIATIAILSHENQRLQKYIDERLDQKTHQAATVKRSPEPAKPSPAASPVPAVADPPAAAKPVEAEKPEPAKPEAAKSAPKAPDPAKPGKKNHKE